MPYQIKKQGSQYVVTKTLWQGCNASMVRVPHRERPASSNA